MRLSVFMTQNNHNDRRFATRVSLSSLRSLSLSLCLSLSLPLSASLSVSLCMSLSLCFCLRYYHSTCTHVSDSTHGVITVFLSLV